MPRLARGGELRSASWLSVMWVLAFALGCGCSSPAPEPVRAAWVVGQAMPSFDPQGPPDPVRWSIERLLSRGLVEEDSTGRVVLAAAESVEVSTDGRTYTFRLRGDLKFPGGRACGSQEFRRSLEAGLNRLDHATYGWLLSALDGIDQVRAGRPLPLLGIATPDDRTLVLRLSRPDSLLLRKLAFPGVAVPWDDPGDRGASGWRDGIGAYGIASVTPGGITLGKRQLGPGPDTLAIRFVSQASRVRGLLRTASPDLVWPIPFDLLDQQLPPGYASMRHLPRPARRLLLVMRAELPPTTKAAARHVFAHGIKRSELVSALGPSGYDLGAWLPGAPPFDFPRHDLEVVRDWLERGDLGRSLHVVMAYSSEGSGARIARTLQAEWARLGLDVELRPLKSAEARAEALRRGGAQLLLVESRALFEAPAAELAVLVQPLRGPPIGAFRTGWNTREFDPWTFGGSQAPPLDVATAQQRLADEHVVLPLAGLPWLWVQREGASVGFHPGFGPLPGTTIPGVRPEPR